VHICDTGKPCFVDAKHHWHWYFSRNVTIFPNEHERVGGFMADQVVRKLGENGCEHLNVHLPASVSEVVDVTGAGDIFMAGFVFAWSLDFKPQSCLRFANAIAGESCRHVGTYVVPRAFAQAYLDRLRASEAPGQQALDRLSGSNELARQPSQPQGHSAAAPSISRSVGNLLGDCMSAAIAGLNLVRNLPDERIDLRSPSAPTELNASRIQEGLGSSDGLGTKSQLGAQAQSPSESEHQREHRLRPDRSRIPEQS
jgi:pfkB family carbohydrate kinase